MARIAFTSFSCRRFSTGRTCRQPTEACAYQVPRVPCFSNTCREALRVVRKVDQRHRAILDEGDRLPLLLHRHHDVEAGGAHVRDRGLQRRIGHFDHATPFGAVLVEAEAEIAHHGGEFFQPPLVLHFAFIELDQQDRLRLAVHEGL